MLDTAAAWEPLSSLFEMVPSQSTPSAELLTNYPWRWSAIALAVLFGLSLCILSLRVRSLDRLR
jgi:hypothetical protein